MALRQIVDRSRWSQGWHTFAVAVVLLVAGLSLDGCETIGRIAHGDPSVQVVIRTDPPGAKVILDGKELGLSPVTFHDPSGSQKAFAVEMQKDGYEPALRVLERKWDTMRLTHRLDPVYLYTLYPLPVTKDRSLSSASQSAP